MVRVEKANRGYGSAESRWARFGPYYAMFPVDFAFDVIRKYSEVGDYILDPFAGRCTSIYAGAVQGRHSLGVEINPVGWLYGAVKLNPAKKELVLARAQEIFSKRHHYSRAIEKMPMFYRMCFCDEVLKFLLASRSLLEWKANQVDRTLMSFITVYLHGRVGEGLSNQMRMSKAMGMNYSMDWWRQNGFRRPPKINPIEFLVKRIEWRYKYGIPGVAKSKVVFGDSVNSLDKVVFKPPYDKVGFSLLFTSPPYYSITDYHADQWLRLWLLGEDEMINDSSDKHRGRFGSQDEYYELLDTVFEISSDVMRKRSTIYVRTDKRKFTFDSTLEILENRFPKHKIRILEDLFSKKTQTQIHGNSSKEVGEIDIILTRN